MPAEGWDGQDVDLAEVYVLLALDCWGCASSAAMKEYLFDVMLVGFLSNGEKWRSVADLVGSVISLDTDVTC